MAATTDDMEVDLALVERVKSFLTRRPMYVRDSSDLVELIVTGVGADSRTELMRLEETVAHLVRYNEIVLGTPERDDECGFGRGSGPLVRRVIWVE